MNRSGFNIHIAILDDCRGKFLDSGLRTPAFAPKQILSADILHLPPTFGSTCAGIFLVHAGPDRDKMDLLAKHVFGEWSLRGSVLNIVFHPCPIVDEDVFKLWRLDSIERFNAPEQMIVIDRSHTEPREEVRAELLRFLEWFFREP